MNHTLKLPVICSQCGKKIEAVCDSFNVTIGESEFDIECLGCQYERLKIREQQLDYNRRRMEEILTNALRK